MAELPASPSLCSHFYITRQTMAVTFIGNGSLYMCSRDHGVFTLELFCCFLLVTELV